jgi:hypothetical protein
MISGHRSGQSEAGAFDRFTPRRAALPDVENGPNSSGHAVDPPARFGTLGYKVSGMRPDQRPVPSR